MRGKLPAVHVLLSSYNGEKYISEQINSILAQRDVDVILHIRDDGSSDSTKTILQKYKTDDPRIELHFGPNIGYIQSFMWLLQNCAGQEDDYYAFADQDDIWDEDKLISAVRKLEGMNPEKPLLYYSDLSVVDETGTFIRKANSWEGTIDKYKIAMFVGVRGCTEVFNFRLRQLLKDVPTERISSHDTFTALAAFWLGEVTYDPESHIRYRQTGNNTSITGTNRMDHFYKNLVYVKRRLTKRKHIHENNAKILVGHYSGKYGKELDDLKKVALYRSSIGSRIRLIRDRRFFRFSLQIRLFNDLFILLGKL